MKSSHRSLLLTVSLVFATTMLHPVMAQENHSHDHASTITAKAEGIVRKIDRQKGTVTLAHGPLPNGMPAMTMPFRAREAKWLPQFQEGQKIRFSMHEESGGTLVLDGYETIR